MKEEFVLSIFYSFLVGGFGVSGSMLDKYMQKPGSPYHGRYTRDIHEPELLIPRRVFEDGRFHTYSLPKFYDRREIDERRKRSISEDKLHLVLPFNGVNHHVELIPHHEFISPNMVVETRGAGISKNLNEGVRFKRIPDQQCHYTGFIRDHDNSKAVLSLCDGVAGYVQTNDARYFIEPLSDAKVEEDGQHVHMVYKRQAPYEKESESKVSNRRHCGTDNDWESAWAEQLAKRQQLVKNNPLALKRANSKESVSTGTHSIHRYIEIGLIADRRFLDFHNSTDYEQYLLTIMNMASEYYHDSSSGNQIDIVVVRIIYLEKEKEEIDLKISPAASETLASFAAWAHKMNPKDFDHPNHHDIGVLVTRYDICADADCDLLGLAYVAAACDPPKAACINEDAGLLLGIVITHEVGHVMGCGHDEVKISGCQEKDTDGSFFIMSPIVFIYTIRWSPCSKKFMTNLLETGLGECLNDNPKNPPDKYKFPNMLPGAMYNAEFQCNLDYPGTKVCELGETDLCEQLWCQDKTSCNSRGVPPADGTKCGENKWCIHKKCVEMGARPAAVHGGWGNWGKMSECSRTCGGGIKTATRECDKPVPANGGRYCIGERRKLSMCNTTPCDEKQPSYRAVQCAEYNNNSVLTDGAHGWQPYLFKENMCALYCVNEKKTYVKLAPMVKDGTPCKAGTNYVCIFGTCRKVGCDWVVDSDAVDDVCGICKGDGTQCSVVEGEFTKTGVSDYNKIVTLPKGSGSIEVREVKECENTLALKLTKDGQYCLNGKHVEQRNGEYPCAGSIIIYSHPEPKREEVEIKGPLTEDVDLQYIFYKSSLNPGVRYKYYVKSTNSSYTPKYLWDFVEWSSCSADCNGGTMISEPTCIEQQAGKVTASFCQGISRPDPKSQVCNEQPCKAKWRVSQWSKCSACGGKKGVKRRKVQCVKISAHSGGDDVQANLDACKGAVPRQSEDCTGTRPCRKKCNKKTRDTEKKMNTGRLAEDRTISLDEQRRMIDKVVDIDMARYLDKPFADFSRGSKSNRRNVADDFRHLLHDWVVSNYKYKRTCENGTSENSKVPKYTTPKPGSIVMDIVPPSQIILKQAPYRDELQKSNLSDRAFQEEGDAMPMGIDTKQEKIYTGAEAAKLIKELNHHESSDQQSEVTRATVTTVNGTTLHDGQNKLGNVSSTTVMSKT